MHAGCGAGGRSSLLSLVTALTAAAHPEVPAAPGVSARLLGKLQDVSTYSHAPQGLRTDDGVATPLVGSCAIPTKES